MKKAAGVAGLVLAAVFLYLALNVKVPNKYISSWGSDKMTEYVGGDAYNFIIEASLRGGEIAGAEISKAIYFAASALLGVISLAFLAADPEQPKPVDPISELEKIAEQEKNAIEQLQKIEKKLGSTDPESEKQEEADTETEPEANGNTGEING